MGKLLTKLWKNNYLKCFVLTCVIIIFICYYLLVHTKYRNDEYMSEQLFNKSYLLEDYQDKESPKSYLVWSSQCKILDIDPWDVSIRQYVNPVKSIKVGEMPQMSSVEPRENVGNVLKLKGVDGNSTKCCYSVIRRVSEDFEKHTAEADNKYSLSTCLHFETEEILSNTTEFIYVECTKNHQKIYKNVHATVPLLPKVLDRISNYQKTNDSKKLNVLLLGIDSISRLALQRLMPETFKYFTKNSWIELKGYNKIGYNTFPNLLALLSGRNETENRKLCCVVDPKMKEPCRLIWDDFRENEYVTAYAEDYPTISTFNYYRTGFITQPTDYYLRPFLLAGEKLLKHVNFDERPVGFGQRTYVDYVLGYAKNFVETFNNFNNFFGLFWMNGLSHDDNNLARVMDLPFKKFLTDLEKLEVYENTLVIAFSDHGKHYGPILKTYVGYYEERLPFIHIWVPKWFGEKNPEKYQNLLKNQNRLTNHYDVYVTLLKLLNENGTSEACPDCKSLFEEVPDNRSCDDAAIGKNWCMCSSVKDISTTDPLLVEIGQFFFRQVQKKTHELLQEYQLDESLCEERQFLNITRGFQTILNDHRKKEFVLAIETNPGPALFEAKIQVNYDIRGVLNMTLVKSISRLDSYAKTSKCVNVKELKNFCHCR